MIGTLIGIVFAVIILGVVWWAIQTLMPLIPIAEPFKTILHVLMVLILVLIVLWIMWQILVASGVMSMGASLPTLGGHSR
jgi:hypothetical protein